LILIGSGVLLATAVSSNGGIWFHVGEIVSTLVILIGLAGFLTGSRSQAR
jgi:hypothetical protein